MSLKVAVIADDLTGALDSSTPFVLAGLTVAAATRPEGLDAALASRSDVVVVNTASRAMRPGEAAEAVAAVAAKLRAVAPELVFKKIDSRLKGNVFAETEAAAAAFGFESMVVAPAIPDQNRPTVKGAVTGHGVPIPLAIAPHVPAHAVIADAATDADLDRLAAATDWSQTLAVGARGLGAAFARRFGARPVRPFEPHENTLFAIGSHDPITANQIDGLNGSVVLHEALLGGFRGSFDRLPALLQSTGAFAGPDSAISRRFAATAVEAVESLGPDTLVMSGGDTALAILDALGAGIVFPQGEALPGLPWFLIGRQNRPSIRCIVKSGGFGGPGTLADLLPKMTAR